MVEADLYMNIYEAYEGGSKNFAINLSNACPISKVVWSSFDFMTGPELRFVWPVMSPTSCGGESSVSIDGCSSDDAASFSKDGSCGNYEEIDDMLKCELIAPELEKCPFCLRNHSAGEFLCEYCEVSSAHGVQFSRHERAMYLDEFMVDSESTLELASSGVTDEDQQSGLNISWASSSQAVDEDRESCVNQKCIPCNDEQDSFQAAPVDLSKGNRSEKTDCESDRRMTESAVDSGIGGTTSILNELIDSACAQPSVNYLESENVKKSPPTHYRDRFNICESGVCCSPNINNVCYTSDVVGENNTSNLSDEEFVAKFVLAEQICSIQMPSNPVLHKLIIAPTRRLLSGSYIFQVKGSSSGDRPIYALSILTDLSKQDWYMQRQVTIECMFTDLVSRLKAAYIAENVVDYACRITQEVSKILDVLAALEQYPLCPSIGDVKIRRTSFSLLSLSRNIFLAQAITAVLQCKGYCVVVGDSRNKVDEMLNTLCFFVSEEWRWTCLKPYKHPYSPYIRLQAIYRDELERAVTDGTSCHWCPAFIDLDKRIVSVSSVYSRHRSLKQAQQKEDALQILLSLDIVNDSYEYNEIKKLKLRNCVPDTSVREFLAKIDFLPFDHNIRVGFIEQFMLYIENRAKALINFLQDISKPNDLDKRSAISSKWNLKALRKALDLTADSTFSIVVAEADRILPDIAEFICQFR